jgi:hypothetical protein
MSKSVNFTINEDRMIALGLFKMVMQAFGIPTGQLKIAPGITVNVDSKAAESVMRLTDEQVKQLLFNIKSRLEDWHG